MEITTLIKETLGDYWQTPDNALNSLTPQELAWNPYSEYNSIAFIPWHLARVEDQWIQMFARDVQPVWVSDEWFQKLGISKNDMGAGVDDEYLARFPTVSIEHLNGYLHAVRKETKAYLQGLK